MADWKKLKTIKIGNKTLYTLIKNHEKWLHEGDLIWRDKRLDLSKLTLEDLDLSGLDLSCVTMIQTRFINCNLSNTKMPSSMKFNCIFRRCNIENSSFRNSWLDTVSFDNCKMDDASFVGSKIDCIWISNCEYSGVNFGGTDIYNTRFDEIDFGKLDINGLKLATFHNGCAFTHCKNEPYIPMACPEIGSFIGYKVAKVPNRRSDNSYVIVVLEIPADARRSSAFDRKCRCDKAKVLRIENLRGKKLPKETVAWSCFHDSNPVRYRADEIVTPHADYLHLGSNFDPYRFNECSTGIHFFMNRQDAVNYIPKN